MCQQDAIARKRLKLRNDIIGTRGFFKHLVRYASKLRDERGYLVPNIDQRIKRIRNLAIFDTDGTDFDNVAEIKIQARRFRIDSNI